MTSQTTTKQQLKPCTCVYITGEYCRYINNNIMPHCIKCPSKQSRLNVGNLCTACFRNNPELRTILEDDGACATASDNLMELNEIAGIPMSDMNSYHH